MIRAADIHARLGTAWPHVLAQLGIADDYLRKKPGPCPACGGRDRFTFDNRRGRGDYLCRGCGAGDGFQLLARVHGWEFSEARRQVMAAAGIRDEQDDGARFEPINAPPPREEPPAAPPERVHRLRRGLCPIENCADAVDYLVSRGLWPLPAGCSLKAHAGVDYFEERTRVGRFPAIVADVRDASGELVTTHVTYLHEGRKLNAHEAYATHEPRKLLSALTGREGCAVRLMPLDGSVLGIAEGVETALSAAALEGVPVWAALNTALLAKFIPPPEVSELVIFADRDEGGLLAALALAERMQGRVRFRSSTPRPPAKDWNDALIKTGACNER